MEMSKELKKETLNKFMLEDKIRDYFEIFDLFSLKGIAKFSNLVINNTFNKLEIQINKKDFFAHQKLAGYIPFIYKKRKIIIKN